MKRQYSGKKLVIVIFFVMLTVAVLCLTVCGGYALYNSMQDMENHNSWILVMHNEYGILDWMLSHRKP